jgi:glycine cleavage system H lipoate-binding protein
MATVEEIRSVFNTYFTPDYTGQLDEDLIQKILKLYEEEKLGSNKIAERLLKENKLNINQGVIGRILTKAKKNNIVRTIPKKELTSSIEQVVQGEGRKIHNVVRKITELDRKQNPDIPVNAKYKIVFATPGGKTTKIPQEFIGVKYFNTEAEANTALNKRLTSNFQPVGDPAKSSVKRAQTRASNVKAVTKLSSAADKANIKAIEGGISEINKYFKKDPDLINTTNFGKNIKAMMSLRLDKDTGNFYSKLRPDNYYFKKASEGQLFDLFDINPVAGKKPGGRFATNVNISPNQFNRAFVGAQLTNFFNKGVNEETASQLDSILKERNIRVDLPNVGKVGAAGGDVAFDSKTGSFPRIIKTLESMEAPAEIKNLFTNIRADAVAGGQICSLVRTKKANGGTISCVDAVEEAIQKEPEKLVQKASRLDKFKNAATGFLGLLKKGGKFGALAAAGAAGAGLVKTFMNDDPTTYLSDENQQKNMLIEMVTGPMVDKPDSTPEILDYQLPAIGATAAAGTAVTAPSTIEAARSARFGKKPSGYTKTALKTLGRGLATTGTPLGLAAFEPLHIAGQVQAGDSLGEIATNPWNYAGLAFADDLSKFATKGLGPNIAKAMRLGISPAALRIGSRFLGLPGLALSLGISGYEMYDDYKKKRGMFSEE